MLVISTLLVIQHSACSPLENNEKLIALSERFDKLQTKVESLESENEALKIRVGYLEKKDIENEVKMREQEKEIIQLRTNMDKQLESIKSTGTSPDKLLVTDLRSSISNKSNSIYRKESSSDDSWTRAAAPSSCRELSLIGHILDGLYLVQNLDTKKVETVLCTFGTSVSQDLIGQVDVKTKSVHFYVQRNQLFNTTRAVIPFNVATVNEGNAFDLSAGIFTVPVPGIYHFDFSAVKSNTDTFLSIYLQVNGEMIGLAYTSLYNVGTWDSESMSASLRLAAGDRVNMYLAGGALWDTDGDYHFTHFSGWLVEEDLM